MPYSLPPGAAAIALGIAVLGASPLSAQRTDSTATPHVMAAVVVKANHSATAAENRRLSRELARYDERILTLEHHLDSLTTYADSLDRDRVYFEAAAAQARARRSQVERRLRELEARKSPPTDTPLATP